MDTRPIRRFRPDPGVVPDDDEHRGWPLTVPAVAQIAAEGLELPAGALVLVGENGSGKSTVMELLAVTLGLNAEGGSAGTQLRTRESEPGSLGLVVERSPGAARWAYFLRDETLHGLYSYLEANRNPFARTPEPRFHELSHGEAFLQVLGDRARGAGTYLLDEPDAALSFGGSLALVAVLLDLVADGAQQKDPVLPALRRLRAVPWTGPGRRLGPAPGPVGGPGADPRLAAVPRRPGGLPPAPRLNPVAHDRVAAPRSGHGRQETGETVRSPATALRAGHHEENPCRTTSTPSSAPCTTWASPPGSAAT